MKNFDKVALVAFLALGTHPTLMANSPVGEGGIGIS